MDTCANVQTVGALGILNRGAETIVAPGAANLKESACVQCGRCIDACPTGAISAQEKPDEVIYYAHQYGITTVAQVSADITERLAELCEIEPSELDLRTVAAGLRKIGIDYVMLEDYALAQTQTVAQKLVTDAISAQKTIFVTSSHSADKFVGNNYPDIAKQMIRYPSAQQQFRELVHGDWAKSHQIDPPNICSISVTQTHTNAAEAVCTGSINYVIDANELYRIFIRTGVNLKKIPLRLYHKIKVSNH